MSGAPGADKHEDQSYDAASVVPHGLVQGTLATIKRLLVNSAGVLLTKTTLVPSDYDYVSYGYTGINLTSIVYKTGGAGGTTVMTKTLGYDGDNNLTSVTIT